MLKNYQMELLKKLFHMKNGKFQQDLVIINKKSNIVNITLFVQCVYTINHYLFIPFPIYLICACNHHKCSFPRQI